MTPSTPLEREAAVKVLTELMLWYREKGWDDLEDDVTNILDAIVGWCGPHARPPSWRPVPGPAAS